MTAEKKTYPDFFENGSFNYPEYLHLGRLHAGALVLLLVAIGVFLHFTLQAGIGLYQQVQAIIPSIGSTPLPGLARALSTHKAEILAIALVAMLVFYIVSLLALNVLKLIGAVFIWFITALTAGLSLLLVYMAREVQGNFEYFFLVCAVIPPVVLAFVWKRLKIASRLINLTADLLMKNKRIFWNGLVFGILYVLLTAGIWMIYINTFVQLSAGIEGVILQVQATDMSRDWFAVGMTFLYFLLVQVTYNYYYGGVVHMAHAFYRRASEGHLDGFTVMARRFRPILTYSVFSSIIYTIKWVLTQMAKKSKDVERLSRIGIKVILNPKSLLGGALTKKSLQQRLANWAIKMLEKLWLLINFFTLPAIVIENKNAPAAIKRSIEWVGSNVVDVFIRKTAVRHAFRFTTVIFIILSILAGAIVGLLFLERFNMDVTTALIVFMIMFGLFSGVPAWVMSKNLDVVYVSFLYCYLLDEDLQKVGVMPPSRFFGSTDPMDGKRGTMTRSMKANTAIGSILASIACACFLYATITLVQASEITMSSSATFHPWLEQISIYNGYGAMCLMLALLFCAFARRKYLVIGIVMGIAAGWFAVIYINYFRPPGSPWDVDTTLKVFKIFIGGLDVVAIASFLLGGIVEGSLLKQDLNVDSNLAAVHAVLASASGNGPASPAPGDAS